MGGTTVPGADRGEAWRLAARQHGVVTRGQLLELGLTPKAIAHRRRSGRLHALHRGVYAVGRPQLTQQGRWMAAVFACGKGAGLSHGSAAALWGIGREDARIEVSVPRERYPRCSGLKVHRRSRFDLLSRGRIPATSPVQTLIDLAARASARGLEAAINAADRLDLVDPEALRRALEQHRGEPGVAPLRRVLDRRTFVLTDSELERRFLPIARRAGLPRPETGVRLHGFKLDFLWRGLGLVVETDGLRYHRTAAQQARDRRRDQALAAAGMTPLRFTHAQVAYEPEVVERTLSAVANRLRR